MDASLTAGVRNNKSERVVNAVAGQEVAVGTYDDLFFTPSVTFGKPVIMPYRNIPLTLSITLRYTGQWSDGYTETGLTTANLTVDDRYSHVVTSRFEVESALKEFSFGRKLLRVRARTGLDASAVMGDENVDITVLGQTTSFNPNGRDYLVDGFIGLTANYHMHNVSVAYAEVEAKGNIGDDITDNFGLYGKAGIKINF